MITVEVKNGSASRATARGYGGLEWILAGDKIKCHWIGALLKSHKKKKNQQIAVIPLVTMEVVLPNN
jgi:hypothetical protein